MNIENGDASSSIVLVCEHASAYIPDVFENLGLDAGHLTSHAVWDPGAYAVAVGLAERLDAALVSSGVSRLVYDCNRPPEAKDAMPERSEVVDVPGNLGLSEAERQMRVDAYYRPFQAALRGQIAKTNDPVVVTIHSFTPTYHGEMRAVEIGILHDTDPRLADAMLQIAPDHSQAITQRNAPYGPEDGVTHTLKEHALTYGHLNVMIEIRNDLIATKADQTAMAAMLAPWITAALANQRGATCVA